MVAVAEKREKQAKCLESMIKKRRKINIRHPVSESEKEYRT